MLPFTITIYLLGIDRTMTVSMWLFKKYYFTLQKNPVDSHIAVGERGHKPSVLIYNWPNFDIVQKLSNGTTNNYVFLAYRYDYPSYLG